MSRRARLFASAWIGLAGCDLSEPSGYDGKFVQGGDAERGQIILASGVHGCTACHAIPGIGTVKGVVGPPLDGIARRGMIAGQLPNTPGVLVAFIQNAPAMVPETGMPNVGLTVEEARHIAAYLYTLEPRGAL